MFRNVCDTWWLVILAHKLDTGKKCPLYDTVNPPITTQLGLGLNAAALQARYEKSCYRCDYVVKITSAGALTRLL